MKVTAVSVPGSYAEAARESRIFKQWLASLDPRFAVSEVLIHAVDCRGEVCPENVMFVRMRVRAANASFEQIVELRGGTSVMLVVLCCQGIEYTVLVRQARLATGCWDLAEIPAGMIDGGSFGGAAARELDEELGLVFSERELTDLTCGEGVYLSPGLLDEQARFYLAQREVTPAELAALRGKATGVAGEGESITLEVILLKDLVHRTRDGKALIAWALYNACKGESS